MAERLERKMKHQKHRSAQTALHNQLTDSLRIVALRTRQADIERVWGGEEMADKGPWSAARDYRRLTGCQSEWIGYKASCCAGKTVAVPIGCNHRLCPFCNAGRLEHYRGPAREMLEAMKHPCFLTLTIPNVKRLTRKTFTDLRNWWKEFRRSNAIVGIGGLYSIEVTFNRMTQEWHPHLHILFDAPFPLSLAPTQFRALKHRLEFAWLRITSSGARKLYGRKESDFTRWVADCKRQERGSSWNAQNRRVIDVRRVQKGDGAVYEVIKYISKTNRFLDLPGAVEEYLRAVRGVRIIQTFGSFYNFKIERDGPPETFLRCECGENAFHRVGVYGFASVYQAENGCWYVRPPNERQRCRGGTTERGE